MSGELPRETVALVLTSNGVNVSESIEDGKKKTTMIKDTKVEVQFFRDMVPRKIIMRLAHKFGIPPHFFWHPEMMPEGTQPPGLRPS